MMALWRAAAFFLMNIADERGTSRSSTREFALTCDLGSERIGTGFVRMVTKGAGVWKRGRVWKTKEEEKRFVDRAECMQLVLLGVDR